VQVFSHGPVHVFDPQGLAAWPEQLRWAPERGCEDPLAAILRAKAFTSGSRAGVGVENGDFWSGMTQAVIRCYLHAAALDERPISEVLRWAGAPGDPEPVRILRRSSGAADGWAEELAEQVGADPRQRGSVWAGVRRAFDSLADPRVLEACSPKPDEAYGATDFIEGCGTLYLLGSSGAQLSVAPLITAMIEDIVETGRALAATSPQGRLDPPLLLMVDEVANIAPLPSLPSLLSDGGGVGIPTVAVFQSLGQARSRWGHETTDAMWDASTIKMMFGGLSRPSDLQDISRLVGNVETTRQTISKSRDGTSESLHVDQEPLLAPDELRRIPTGNYVVLHRNSTPVFSSAAPRAKDRLRRIGGARQVLSTGERW
jgi:type IV secretion system protein VirD4